MIWQDIAGNSVLIPPQPVALIHFLGGAFVATAPQATYRRLLEGLADQGYAVITTPFITTIDHAEIADNVLYQFEQALGRLHQTAQLQRFLPIYGMGHSMGCKLHLLIGSLFEVKRAGNILISFNNSPIEKAIPLAGWITPVVPIEFSPSPEQTNRLVQQQYQVPRNLLVKFSNDTLDQTLRLSGLLERRFPGMISVQRLAGNHLTPLGQEWRWQPGDTFTPLDAMGQWFQQELYRELNQLERTIVRWLDPLWIN
ncbi:MAG: DUF1350 family protein [Acaryochloris sp. RU_4_1]|nr:DUF1350 family protein [Acaryochloris sp. RU_4_1]NJR55693.1 DUF1350 family protein [Acaryochloris sp. CRU_2_0]